MRVYGQESLRKRVQAQIVAFEKKRNLSRICVVVDMDMFFAAVEIRDNPSLKDKPVAVGGTLSTHEQNTKLFTMRLNGRTHPAHDAFLAGMSMICTANYVARKYGVRSAMPGFIAKRYGGKSSACLWRDFG